MKNNATKTAQIVEGTHQKLQVSNSPDQALILQSSDAPGLKAPGPNGSSPSFRHHRITNYRSFLTPTCSLPQWCDKQLKIGQCRICACRSLPENLHNSATAEQSSRENDVYYGMLQLNEDRGRSTGQKSHQTGSQLESSRLHKLVCGWTMPVEICQKIKNIYAEVKRILRFWWFMTSFLCWDYFTTISSTNYLQNKRLELTDKLLLLVKMAERRFPQTVTPVRR